ncbi:MAG TPA: hypothetical protein PK575_07340, partial [Syntrophorhabdus sp.]|nr:hypothetical protein [Syntrophorhabdus sp.]HQI96522.1 hypothetical protein [Syntrophorhabdus sp.]
CAGPPGKSIPNVSGYVLWLTKLWLVRMLNGDQSAGKVIPKINPLSLSGLSFFLIYLSFFYNGGCIV